MKIGGIEIGDGHPPFIVAEMSGNHNQSLERALELVDAAAAAGAHSLKLQTYTADTMTLDIDRDEFRVGDPGSLWAGRSLYELYQEAHTPWDWHKPIFDRAKALGMIAFSTPFDDTAVDFLETLNVPCYKIASFENTDLPLISRTARTGKPIIISTGMASVEEIGEAVAAVRAEGNDNLVLLRCVSAYPASPAEANLMTIPDMRKRFGCEVGLSDHTMGVGVAAASVAFGATVIEKHFTLKRADGGVDSAFSLEPEELKALVVETRNAWQARGSVHYGVSESEKSSIKFRRSLYVIRDLKPGDVLSADDIRAIRPGLGLAPKFTDQVLGRRAKIAIARGTPLSWDLLA